MTDEARAKIREALETGKRDIERSMPEAPKHVCGPESGCDGQCVDYYSAIRGLEKFNDALALLSSEDNLWTDTDISHLAAMMTGRFEDDRATLRNYLASEDKSNKAIGELFPVATCALMTPDSWIIVPADLAVKMEERGLIKTISRPAEDKPSVPMAKYRTEYDDYVGDCGGDDVIPVSYSEWRSTHHPESQAEASGEQRKSALEAANEIWRYCDDESQAAEVILKYYERPAPPDEKALREPVAWFAGEMEKKLQVHDIERGKSGWSGATYKYLLDRLKDELAELYMTGESSAITEAADVANFAMMIADNARRALAHEAPQSERRCGTCARDGEDKTREGCEDYYSCRQGGTSDYWESKAESAEEER